MSADKDAVERIGSLLARGAIWEVWRWTVAGVAMVLLANAIASWLGFGWDPTDDQSAGVHSEMHLRVDHGTGCQYLESAAGALTPRMGADGRQVCR